MQKTVKTHPALLWLVGIWSLGSAFGILIANGNADTLAASLRFVERSASSMISFSAILPVLAIYIVTQLHLHGLIFPILFLKSMTDSFLLLGISAAYGSAAWLAGAFLLFSDKVATVLLLYFAGKCLTERNKSQTARFIFVLLVIAVVITFDRFCISPYFTNLML